MLSLLSLYRPCFTLISLGPALAAQAEGKGKSNPTGPAQDDQMKGTGYFNSVFNIYICTYIYIAYSYTFLSASDVRFFVYNTVVFLYQLHAFLNISNTRFSSRTPTFFLLTV